MRAKHVVVLFSVVAVALGILSVGCGGGGGSSVPFAGTWTWVSSSWAGPRINGSMTFTPAMFQNWGATVELTVDVKSDGSFTADGVALNVTHGSVDETLTGTVTATADQLTITADDGRILTVNYAIAGDTVMITITTDQLLAFTGRSLPSVYRQFSGGTVVVSLQEG